MASRQQQERLKQAQDGQPQQKKLRMDAPPPAYLTDSQIAHMNQLQQMQYSLTPQQKTYLRNLQHQYQLMVQHQNSLKQAAPAPATATAAAATGQPSALEETAEATTDSQPQLPRLGTTPQSTAQAATANHKPPAYLSQGDLQALLSPRPSAVALAEGLIAEFGLASRLTAAAATGPESSLANGVRPTTAARSAESSTKSDSSHQLSIEMTATQILDRCKGLGKSGKIDTSVLETSKPPTPPDPPYPPAPKDKLLPPTPSVFVSIHKHRPHTTKPANVGDSRGRTSS